MWNGTYCWIVRLVQVLQFKRLTASNISFALGHKKANGSCWWRGTHRTAWRCGSLCTPNFHTYSRFPKRSALHRDRKSTRLNSSHDQISYAVFCLKKKKNNTHVTTTA